MRAEAIKVYCTGKIRNNRGQVIEYKLININGNTAVFDKKHMAQLLRDGRYDVMNLQLDTLGRIVDKAIPKEKETIARLQNKSQVSDKSAVFEDAYNFMTRNNGTIMILHHKNYSEMTEPFNRLQNINDIREFEREFENFLMQRHNFRPTKIIITNQSQDYLYIIWSTAYADVSLLDNDNFFVKFDNINHFNISCQYYSNTCETYKKVATIQNKNTGQVVEDAFCGIVVYDRNNGEAVDFAQENIKKIEAAVKSISKTVPNKNNNTGTGGIMLDKMNNNPSRVTLVKNNNTVSLDKTDKKKRGFFGLFNMFKR